MRSSRRATPHLVVDEVHAMGSCEPAGCCMIALLWLEDRMQGTCGTKLCVTSSMPRVAQQPFVPPLASASIVPRVPSDTSRMAQLTRCSLYCSRRVVHPSAHPFRQPCSNHHWWRNHQHRPCRF